MSALLTAWIGSTGQAFERVSQALEALGHERPHPSEEDTTGTSGERIVEQYAGRLSQAEILDIMAYGLLTGSLTLWSLRNGKFRITQQDITGLSEVFRERMFLHSEDYREGMIIRSVTGDPLGGGGTVQYEMTLTPEGITLWGIDNGGPIWYRYRPEEVIQLHPAQAQRLFAIEQRLHENTERDLEKREYKCSSPPPDLPDADWYCQECGHSWNGSSGKPCPRCGETTMILSPCGRDQIF